MKKAYRTGILVLLLLIAVIGGTFVYSKFFIKKGKNKFTVVVDTISNYNYTLDKRDTDLMREKFKDLKKLLKSDNVDFKEYSSLISQLYIIDLYSIDNKVNKYDFPSLEYIYESETDKFKSLIKDGFYSKVIDNSNKDRNQELPLVKSINVLDIVDTTFIINGNELSGYEITLEWDYVKDLGYDKKAKVITVVDNNRVYVVKHSPIID